MIAIVTNSNPKFNLLLLPLLLGFPSPLFAGSSTDGYKQEKSCIYENQKFSLWKKEDDNSKNWGTYYCEDMFTCIWASKGVSYDEANDQYEKLCGN